MRGTSLAFLRFTAIQAGEGEGMLWTIVVILLLLWLVGLVLDVVGGLIHVLLVVALVVIVARMLSGRRA